jgi:hypothetical protein
MLLEDLPIMRLVREDPFHQVQDLGHVESLTGIQTDHPFKVLAQAAVHPAQEGIIHGVEGGSPLLGLSDSGDVLAKRPLNQLPERHLPLLGGRPGKAGDLDIDAYEESLDSGQVEHFRGVISAAEQA